VILGISVRSAQRRGTEHEPFRLLFSSLPFEEVGGGEVTWYLQDRSMKHDEKEGRKEVAKKNQATR